MPIKLEKLLFRTSANILRLIYRSEEPIIKSDISKQLYMHDGYIAALVRRLEDTGIVKVKKFKMLHIVEIAPEWEDFVKKLSELLDVAEEVEIPIREKKTKT